VIPWILAVAVVACDGLMFHVVLPGHGTPTRWLVIGWTMMSAALASGWIVLELPHQARLVLSVFIGLTLITTAGTLSAKRLAARAQRAGKG
jgi:hypothetical protein